VESVASSDVDIVLEMWLPIEDMKLSNPYCSYGIAASDPPLWHRGNAKLMTEILAVVSD